VVFPAPKGPKTTILHFLSSGIIMNYDNQGFYYFDMT